MKKVDMKEYELPDTVFVRDIEDSVFQGIVLQCLAKIRRRKPDRYVVRIENDGGDQRDLC